MRITSTTTTLALTLTVLTTCASVYAQQAPAPTPPNPANPVPQTPAEAATAKPGLDEQDWTIRLTPRAWFVAPAGDLKLPGLGGQTVTLDNLNLDANRVRPAGQVDLQSERWMISLAGANSSTSSLRVATGAFQLGTTAIGAGQTFDASFDYTTIQALVGYRVWEYNLDAQKSEDAGDTRFRLFLLGGARLHDAKATIERPGVANTRSEGSLTTVSIIGSARGQLKFWRDFNLEVDLSAGALHESTTFDIQAALSYQPCDWFAAQFGYRHLQVSLDSGSNAGQFKWDGSVAGLFAGVVFKF
jgi:hypothetical protein